MVLTESQYVILHRWIRKNRPIPISGLCEICNIKPIVECANISKKYNRDINDFIWSCRSCHRYIDMNDNWRKNLSISHMGKKDSEETRKKKSEALKKNKFVRHNRLGEKHRPESIAKMRVTQQLRRKREKEK